MKAATLTQYGGKEALEINENAPVPTIKPNEVLVKVRAASVNPFDYSVQSGSYKGYFPVEFPAILGGDVSGTVDQVGEDVSGFSVGQEVYGMAGAAGSHGSFAEYTPVKASQLSVKPKNTDFTTAAALPLASVSAYQALVDHMDLKSGQKILIHGGAGGIGSFAIQIAHSIGAHIVTTVSQADIEYVKSIGADEAIDYKKVDFSDDEKDFDAVFDAVGGETNKKSYSVLKPGGILVSMVAPEDPELTKQYNIKYVHESTKVNPERLAAITELTESGKIKVHIDKTFPLIEAAEALDFSKSNHSKGKVVITVS